MQLYVKKKVLFKQQFFFGLYVYVCIAVFTTRELSPHNYSEHWVSLVGAGNVVDNGVETEKTPLSLYL